MADLIERLRAHLDEDERVAREALARAGSGDVTAWIDDAGRLRVGDSDRAIQAAPTAHVIRHSPARTLRWVAAARQILDAYSVETDYVTFGDWESCSDSCPGDVMWRVIKLLASIYGEEP